MLRKRIALTRPVRGCTVSEKKETYSGIS